MDQTDRSGERRADFWRAVGSVGAQHGALGDADEGGLWPTGASSYVLVTTPHTGIVSTDGLSAGSGGLGVELYVEGRELLSGPTGEGRWLTAALEEAAGAVAGAAASLAEALDAHDLLSVELSGEHAPADWVDDGRLGALIGVQKGLDVYVLDRPTDGLKPELVRDLGATYVTGDVVEQMQQIAPDVVIEATGAVPVISGVLANNVPYGIVCLTGISAPKEQEVDLGHINRDLVLDNGVVVGSVNANLRHYQGAAEVLAKADNAWLERLITRRVPLEKFAEAFERRDGDVKVVIDLV